MASFSVDDRYITTSTSVGEIITMRIVDPSATEEVVPLLGGAAEEEEEFTDIIQV